MRNEPGRWNIHCEPFKVKQKKISAVRFALIAIIWKTYISRLQVFSSFFIEKSKIWRLHKRANKYDLVFHVKCLELTEKVAFLDKF